MGVMSLFINPDFTRLHTGWAKKILQGSAVTQTVLGGLTIYILPLQISYSVYIGQKL